MPALQDLNLHYYSQLTLLRKEDLPDEFRVEITAPSNGVKFQLKVFKKNVNELGVFSIRAAEDLFKGHYAFASGPEKITMEPTELLLVNPQGSVSCLDASIRHLVFEAQKQQIDPKEVVFDHYITVWLSHINQEDREELKFIHMADGTIRVWFEN